jgi:hypothetical protein
MVKRRVLAAYAAELGTETLIETGDLYGRYDPRTEELC